ncbi:putative nuclease HARBI1 [Spodoptera litura]|uniref:Nuclease HARBI1 n=1 Tax=Spodoptera litura TaxID=69820 RepID=A0A9J7IWQ6_SPOLT|nr:putative nuclease HARBI1 [Spodoptera litura]
MANEHESFEFLEADHAETSNIHNNRKRRRMQMREECSPFHLDDTEFVKRYRLTKELVRNLCDEIRPLMRNPQKSTDLSVETKVLIALSFYATGSYQRPTGNNEGHFVAQQTVSSAISQVTTCLNSLEMRNKYIKFPMSSQERNMIKTKFYNKFGIPGCLGCIDGSHVAIVRPAQHEERYYCRKNYHSLNVQLICDSDMQIISVDASHGGATHDSFIWAVHPLKAHIEALSNNENIWFLGDSGYPLRKTMMTPILDAAPDSPEAHYTNLHVRARNVIERTIGLLKARFRCLLIHRVLHYSPEVAGSIVNACVILHNICNRANVPVEPLSNEDMIQEAQLQQHMNTTVVLPRTSNVAYQQGLATRNCLVQRLWERRRL